MGCNSSKAPVVEEPTPEVTEDIKAKVRDTWRAFLKVNEEAEKDFAFYIFVKLFELAPDAKQLFEFVEDTSEESLFANEKLGWHVKRVTDAISVMVNSLDDLNTVMNLLESLGGRHRGYGVKEPYFVPIREGVMFALEKALGDEFPEENKEAWSIVLTLVSHFMIKGIRNAGKEDKSTIV